MSDIIVNKTVKQFTVLATRVAGPRGYTGESAYQYAVRVDGFIGTQVEYYAAMQVRLERAQQAQLGSELAKGLSESAAQVSVTKANESALSKEGAEVAKGLAESALQSAIVKASESSNSAASALVSEQNALVSEQNTKVSEDNAKQSEFSSALSEQNALNSFNGAGIRAELASQYKNDAEFAQGLAETASEVAISAKESALVSANTASTKAGEALVSKDAAKISETNSTNSASASQAAKEAAETARGLSDVSSTLSLAAKESALVSANTATTKASEASQSAVSANNAKTASETAKGLAETAKVAAEAAKGLSEIGANTATTKAAEAAQSKIDADTAKVAAQAAKTLSETGAGTATTKAAAALLSETIAKASEVAAAASAVSAAASKLNAFTTYPDNVTPANTDNVIVEKADGLRYRWSWANIKATLKAYFDTLYLSITSKAIGSDILTGTDDAKYVTAKGINDTEINAYAKHKPLGLKNWSAYDLCYLKVNPVVSTHRVIGNFTCIKRFNSCITAVGSSIFELSNSSSDYLRVGNDGYSFRIIIKSLGTIIYDYSEATSVMFNMNPLDLIFFTEVDYDVNEIRFSYSGYTRTISIPVLASIKTAIFDSIRLDMNSYGYTCRFNILLSGLFSFANCVKLFGPAAGYEAQDIIRREYKNNRTNQNILTGLPITFWAGTSVSKVFSGGFVTYTAAELASQSVGNNNYFFHSLPIDFSKIKSSTANQILQYNFSLTVVSGTLSISGTTATKGIHVLRLIEKNTGVLVTYRNLEYLTTIQIPVGVWQIQIIWECLFANYGTNATGLVTGFRGLTVGGEIKIYNDLVVIPIAVILSALPVSASFDTALCPYTNQFATGAWNLTNTFFDY